MKTAVSRVFDPFHPTEGIEDFLTQNSDILKRPKTSIVVLNPYLPQYRVKFFSVLDDYLSKAGSSFWLVTGNPEKRFLLRRDISTAPFHVTVPKVALALFGHTIRYLRAGKFTKNATAVVYEYSITNLNSWKAVLFRQRHKVILWGHGPGYLSGNGLIRRKLEVFMARRADRVLLYTEPGLERLSDLGVDRSKLDFMNNTFDWAPLQKAKDDLSKESTIEFVAKHSLPEGKVFAFLGALDSTKRVQFLAKVLDSIWAKDKSIRFLIAGEGPEARLLHSAEVRGQAVRLGHVDSTQKALIASVSEGFVNPGNIGLLAVDALVLHRPIFGTKVKSSPEKDYLEEGSSLFTLPNEENAFAQSLLDYLSSSTKVRQKNTAPPLGDFVTRFCDSLLQEASPELPKILFLSNLPAPYRVSLFNQISNYLDVTIGFSGWRDEGRDWLLPSQDSISFKVRNVGLLVGVGPFRFPLPRPGLSRLVRNSELVIVGGWNSPVYIWALFQAQRWRKMSSIWFESTLHSATIKAGPVATLRKGIFRLASTVLTPGGSASKAAKQYSESKLPILQLTNPVEASFLETSTSPFSQSELGTKFLYFGRLLPSKRIDLLIEAFNEIASDDDSLTIVGSGPQAKRLKRASSKSRRNKQIEFLPAVPATDAADVYSEHDVLVLPSNREVWGMVVPEALLRGLSVVTAKSVGCVESYAFCSNLYTFETDSLESLCNALILSKDSKDLSDEHFQELRRLNSPEQFAQHFALFHFAVFSMQAKRNSNPKRGGE